MTISRKIASATTVSFALFAVSASNAFAADACPVYSDGCYDFSGTPPTLGCYLKCMLPELFGVFQLISVALALIFGMILALKIAQNRENPDFLAELPNRVMYLIIFGLLAAGFGGTLLNFGLRFFGFGDISGWLDVVNGFLDKLNEWDTSIN